MVTIGSPTQRTVLAVLLAHEGRAVSAELMMDAVWGENPPPSARRSLRTYVSRLRRVVGDRLESTGGAYRLDLETSELDVREFEHATVMASAMSPSDRLPVLQAALDLWRGPPYSDCGDVEVLRGPTRRLVEMRAGAAGALVEATLSSGQVTVAVAEAEALVADHPLHEAGWALLIRALAAAGRQADALRAYQRAVEALAEAGLRPSEPLRAAEQETLAGELPHIDDEPDAPALAPTTSIVGRENDLAQVLELLRLARVVTLHGPGGVGKTRLAQEVCDAGADHRLGWRFVPLASLTDPATVPSAVADALGLAVDTGSARRALARAHSLDVLVVLDNCEHVVEAVSEVVELLTSRPGPLRVLATSRERIGVPGEHSWSLAPLPTGGPESAATQLFVERARAHAPGLQINAGSRDTIQRIVSRLDGLPLAIEMAAARLGGLGLGDLDALLAERVDILRSAHRRGDPRHRTLAAVIEWSENLLDERERAVWQGLSVFAGHVRAEDIVAVLDDDGAIDTVADLVERSLAVADHRPGRSHYGLLGVVRRYGLDRLEGSGSSEVLRQRHAGHFTDVARTADRDLRGSGEAEASRLVEGLSDELRAAHRWARENDGPTALALSAALHLHAVSRQREEPQRWAVGCRDLLDESRDAVVVLATMAYRANNLGMLDDASAAVEYALELAGADPVARFPLEAGADTALYRGDLELARRLAIRMRDAAEAAHDPTLVVMGASAHALAHAYGGQLEPAISALDSVPSADLAPSAQGWLAYTRGEVLLDHDPRAAEEALVRAVGLADLVDHRFLAGVARVSLASLLGRAGDPADAADAFGRIIEHWRRRGDRTHQVTTLRNAAMFFDRVGEHAAAAELLAATDVVAQTPSFGDEAIRLDQVAANSEAALGARLGRHRDIGARRSVDEAAQAALEVMARLGGQ